MDYDADFSDEGEQSAQILSLDSNVRTIQTKSIQSHGKTFPTRTVAVLKHMPIDSSFVKPLFQTNLNSVSTELIKRR